MSRSFKFERDEDVRWGIVLPPELKKICGMQGPPPVNEHTFGQFIVHGEDALVEVPENPSQFDEHEGIVLEHLGVAVAQENLRRQASQSDEIAEAA